LWSSPAVARAGTLEFVAHAVVANGALVQSCLHTLVYALLPPPGPATPDQFPGQKWAPTPGDAAVQDDVLSTLIKVVELVPTSSHRLLPILASNFPHKLRDRTTHCLYLRGLFCLAEARSGAALREGILASIVDHLIAVDVEIRWEDIVDVVTEEAKEEEGGTVPGEEEPDIFDVEGMSDLELITNGEEDGGSAMLGGGWEGGHTRIASTAQSTARAAAAGGGGTAAAAPEDGVIAIDLTADKLDSMMEMTMEHLERRVASGQLPATWDTTLGAFERTILHTHRSKFVQFLVFYVARYAPEHCCSSFVGLLLTRITDRLQPPITRSAAAAYAGSFLARAGFIPEPLVVEALQRLADWCVRYTREEDRRGGLPPIPSSVALTSLAAVDARDKHAAFFAACQALLYALCYHMEPLLKQKARSAGTQSYLQALNGKSGGGKDGSIRSITNGGGNDLLRMNGVPSNKPDTTSDVLKVCAQDIEHLFAEAMPRLLTHSLDPLSSCARSVVLEFGRQAGTLGHPELYQIVSEWEQRHTAAAMAAMNHHSARPLEVFFPYDPYLLRRSAVHLDLSKSYVKWKKGHPTGAPRAGLHGGGSFSFAANGGSGAHHLVGHGRVGVGAGATGNGTLGGGDDEMWEDELLGRSSDDDLSSSSSEDDSGSDSDSSGDSSSSSSSSSDGGISDSGAIDSDSDGDTDDLRRTRFGSMPGSSLSSGGRGGDRGASKGRGRRFRHHRVPGALKASLIHGGAGSSPTLGMAIPGHVGSSLSAENGGSPWGLSPTGGYFGSFAPMSMGK